MKSYEYNVLYRVVDGVGVRTKLSIGDIIAIFSRYRNRRSRVSLTRVNSEEKFFDEIIYSEISSQSIRSQYRGIDRRENRQNAIVRWILHGPWNDDEEPLKESSDKIRSSVHTHIRVLDGRNFVGITNDDSGP